MGSVPSNVSGNNKTGIYINELHDRSDGLRLSVIKKHQVKFLMMLSKVSVKFMLFKLHQFVAKRIDSNLTYLLRKHGLMVFKKEGDVFTKPIPYKDFPKLLREDVKQDILKAMSSKSTSGEEVVLLIDRGIKDIYKSDVKCQKKPDSEQESVQDAQDTQSYYKYSEKKDLVSMVDKQLFPNNESVSAERLAVRDKYRNHEALLKNVHFSDITSNLNIKEYWSFYMDVLTSSSLGRHIMDKLWDSSWENALEESPAFSTKLHKEKPDLYSLRLPKYFERYVTKELSRVYAHGINSMQTFLNLGHNQAHQAENNQSLYYKVKQSLLKHFEGIDLDGLKDSNIHEIARMPNLQILIAFLACEIDPKLTMEEHAANFVNALAEIMNTQIKDDLIEGELSCEEVMTGCLESIWPETIISADTKTRLVNIVQHLKDLIAKNEQNVFKYENILQVADLLSDVPQYNIMSLVQDIGLRISQDYHPALHGVEGDNVDLQDLQSAISRLLKLGECLTPV